LTARSPLPIRIYDAVHLALWAGLAAFIIIFLVFVAPYIPETQARLARQQELLDLQEVSALCEKWGLIAKTHEHTLCMIDLRKYRGRIEQRIADLDLF
jgi:hypothetical protein